MKIAILTSPHQWFEYYAQVLSEKLENAPIYLDHTKIDKPFDVLFILSYHKIIEKPYLLQHRHNIVVHESDLPAGKGWAPLFWQVLEDKNEIVFSMFEAGDGVDNGDIYMKETLRLTGYELNKELRQKQAELTLKMCQHFVNNYDKYKTPVKQDGVESFYHKRTPNNSELDINKTIKEQFNLLRVVNNENYPAFFELDGHRYRLCIELDSVLGGQLIDFADLSRNECIEVLRMRNHPEVRRWMYSQSEIMVTEHFQFIQNLIGDSSNQYFLVKQDRKTIGVIYFNHIDRVKKEAFFGIYANLFEPVKGAGRLLEELSLFYASVFLKLKQLNLEVISTNKKAINLYKNYGFVQLNKLERKGFEILSMTKKLGS